MDDVYQQSCVERLDEIEKKINAIWLAIEAGGAVADGDRKFYEKEANDV